jgi:CPA2 family monovalent cation:H+ antiporter-2
MEDTLQLVLILLAAAVLVVILFRVLKLPGVLGYLLVGLAIGPSGFGVIANGGATQHLAEFGVVFLMFSVGLEFSLSKLATMRTIVFGFGAAQVGCTIAVLVGCSLLAGAGWRAGVVLGGVLAMSSTAIVSKMLFDRLELTTPHGRQVLGVLLFQDLAVVPLLILIPALAGAPQQLASQMMAALVKVCLVLAILLYFGQRPMRGWFHVVAKQKSSELFVLNVLLITLGLAYVTDRAGLSLALGAFVAGMLISETEYRYQVADDIKPFRDVLLGLFFVTVGSRLDLAIVARNLGWTAGAAIGLVAFKALSVTALSRLFGSNTTAAARTGLDLAQGGEFGFILLALASPLHLLPEVIVQIVLAAIFLSMLAAPFIIERSEHIARHISGAEWMARAMELHNVAVRSMAASQHVVVCGYGRSGQSLGRLLEKEDINFIALDLDPARVGEAARAGEHVVYGDAARREVLIAAGLLRARALVVAVADSHLALSILAQVRALRPGLPVVVRSLDDTDLDRLKEAGATEVLAEVMEGSLMLASHTMMLLGVPLNRIVRHIRSTRDHRYRLLRGFFHGETDAAAEAEHEEHNVMHTVVITPGAAAIGKSLRELALRELDVEIRTVRRGDAVQSLKPDTRIELGDAVVLLGTEQNCAAAEMKLMQG